MKYYTRQWYMEIQVLHLMNLLQPDENAAVFSEEYFREVYAAEEEIHLQNLRELPGGLGDEENARRNFRIVFDNILRTFDEYLTDEIKAMAADMRLLALERATPEVVAAAKKLSDELYARTRLHGYNYEQLFKRIFPRSLPGFLADFDFHDSEVEAFENNGRDIVITFSVGLGNFHKDVVFKNASVLHCDGDITGCQWLYKEIYPADHGYEIHALLINSDRYAYIGDRLMELTLTCSNVSIKSKH